MQKKAEMQKRAKMHFQFQNLYKKGKNEKKESTFFLIFRFYIPCAFFCIFNLKIHAKRAEMQTKGTWCICLII